MRAPLFACLLSTVGCFALFDLNGYNTGGGGTIEETPPPDPPKDGGGTTTGDADGNVQTETRTLLDAFTERPGAERKQKIDALIVTLKGKKVWDKLGVLYVLAAHTDQAALLNWKNPASAKLAGSPLPTFQAEIGFKGNGSASLTAAVDMNAIPGFTQNAAHAAVWTVDDGQSETNDAADIGETTASNGNTMIQPRGPSNRFITQLNDGVPAAIDSTSAVGFFVITRSSASNYVRFKDGKQLDIINAPSVAVTGASPRILGHSDGRSRRTVAIAHWGAALTASDVSTLDSAFKSFLAR